MKKVIRFLLPILIIIISGGVIFFPAEGYIAYQNKQNIDIAFPLDSTLKNYNLIYPDISALLISSKKGALSIDLEGVIVNLTLEGKYLWTGKLKTFFHDGINETQIEIPEPITFKGYVDGYEKSSVRLTFNPDSSWMSGYIAFDDNWYVIEPRQKTKLPDGTTEHYLYTRKNAGEMYGTCGVIDDNHTPYTVSNEVNKENSYSTLKIYCQGDYEFYAINPDDWATRMITVLNDVEGVFEDAINVEFEITGLSVFTSSFEPFTTVDVYDLIEAYVGEFHTADSPSRQIMHIYSGKVLDNNKIGLALGSAAAGRCGGYVIAQQVREHGYWATAYHKMILSAHEIGHCFYARHNLFHYDSIPDLDCLRKYTIMYPYFKGNCQYDYFSDSNIIEMESYDDYLDDSIAPNVSININSDEEYTNSQDVILDIQADDNYPHYFYARRMPISIKNSSEDFGLEDCFYAPVDTSFIWTLNEQDGIHGVDVYCFDITDNLTIITDTIILDQTLPSSVFNLISTSHNINEYSEDSTIDICWESAFDLTSGVYGYSYLWNNNFEIEPDSIIDIDKYATCLTSPGLPNGIYYFSIRAIDSAGNAGAIETIGPFNIGVATVISETESDNFPSQYSFSQNYPNPFNPTTTFSFNLPKRSDVILEIYDILGRKVATVIDKSIPAGRHDMVWGGVDSENNEIPSGIYFAKFRAADFSMAKKIIMMK